MASKMRMTRAKVLMPARVGFFAPESKQERLRDGHGPLYRFVRRPLLTRTFHNCRVVGQPGLWATILSDTRKMDPYQLDARRQASYSFAAESLRGHVFTPKKGEAMQDVCQLARDFLKSEAGPTATGYAVMLALMGIIIVALGAIKGVGTTVSGR